MRSFRPFLWLFLVVALVRLPLLSVPFERDEGEYGYIAWRLGHQELPYRDWVDQKPPGVFLVYAVALVLPLDPVVSVHLVGFFFSLASAFVLFLLARRFVRPGWAWFGAMLFGVVSANPWIQGFTANTEIFMLLPLLLSVEVFLGSLCFPQRVRLFFLAGVLVGVASVFKQVALVNWLLFLVCYPVLFSGGRKWSRFFVFGVWLTVGLLCVWGVVSFFFWYAHCFSQFYDNVFGFNFRYVCGLSWCDRVTFGLATAHRFLSSQLFVWFFAVMAFPALCSLRQFGSCLFLGCWLLLSLVGVSASGYYYPHYFQQALPVVVVLAVVGVQAMCDRLAVRFRLKALLLGGVLLMPPIAVAFPFLFMYSAPAVVSKVYPGLPFGQMKGLAAHLEQVTKPGDKIFIFGAEPELLFYAHRVSATRYIFFSPLFGPYSGVLAKQLAVAREVESARPVAGLYSPLDQYFILGKEQYLIGWSDSYFSNHMQMDACLTRDLKDHAGTVFGLRGVRPLLPAGTRSIGMFYSSGASK